MDYSTKLLCTIVDSNHIYKAISMLISLREVQCDIKLYILLTDTNSIPKPNTGDFTIISLEDLSKQEESVRQLIDKYINQKDELRWALKPFWIKSLINKFPEFSIIYCDCDFCFFEAPDYLFDLLESGGIVLTPHWRPLEPTSNIGNFHFNFKDGLFNAGCITSNKTGLPALTWWAHACFTACELNRENGLFYDQRYLDLMIIYFQETLICRHQGINLADWNIHLRRSLSGKNPVVPNLWPIVLVHFTINTIQKIQRGADPTLEPYFNKYMDFQKRANLLLGT